MRRMDTQPRITRSALRHGITPDDIRHAVAHPLLVFDLQEGQMVVHAMVARRKFLR